MCRLAVGRSPLAEKRSARFDAGSVVKRMVSRDSLKWSATATETVVLPTPPLPPKRSTRREPRRFSASANGERRSANGSLAVAGVNADPALFLLARDLFLPRANVAQRLEHLLLFLGILRLGDVADLQHHLQLDQPLLPQLIVQQ